MKTLTRLAILSLLIVGLLVTPALAQQGSVTLTVAQKVLLTAGGKDINGNPVPVPASIVPIWGIIDPAVAVPPTQSPLFYDDVVTFVTSTDGLTTTITPKGLNGHFEVWARHPVATFPPTLLGKVTVVITGGSDYRPPASFSITAGTPVPK
jgi:hypothetical protein